MQFADGDRRKEIFCFVSIKWSETSFAPEKASEARLLRALLNLTYSNRVSCLACGSSCVFWRCALICLRFGKFNDSGFGFFRLVISVGCGSLFGCRHDSRDLTSDTWIIIHVWALISSSWRCFWWWKVANPKHSRRETRLARVNTLEPCSWFLARLVLNGTTRYPRRINHFVMWLHEGDGVRQ